jgi:hypothetical protein
MRDFFSYFVGPLEQENNDSAAQANGPLKSGVAYQGHHDPGHNDDHNSSDVDKDYFSVLLLNTGNISVDLSNTSGSGTSLVLYYQIADIAHRKQFVQSPPYHIGFSNQPAGWYYIEVVTTNAYGSSAPYTLRATYP